MKSTSDLGASGWAAGSRIGRYKLVLALGGSFGQRFIGVIEDGREQGRLVLLRSLPTESRSAAELELVTRAGITAMVIRHPKIAAVLDVIPDQHQIAVVSEYVEGDTLGELQRAAASGEAPIPPTVALSIIRDAVDALRAARDQWKQMVRAGAGLPTDGVHGGLGPEGITITTLGETMLSEIGVSGALARHPDLIQHPAMLPYRAPEQLSQSRGLMERCDVFTLGVMAWELLANRPLFGDARGLEADDAEHRAATIKAVLHGAIPPLDTLPNAAIPGRVSDVVRNALLRDPLRRLASLDKLAAAIAELPRPLFAPSSEIASVLDQLLRSSLQQRRDSLGHLIAVEHARGSQPPAGRRISVPPRAARELVFDEATSDPGPPAHERPSARPADRSARRRTPPQSFASVRPPEVAEMPAKASAIRTTAIAGTPAHLTTGSRPSADDAETPIVPPVIGEQRPVTLLADHPEIVAPEPAAPAPPAPAQAERAGSKRRSPIWIVAAVAAAAAGGFVLARSLGPERVAPLPPPALTPATAPAPPPTAATAPEAPIGDASAGTGRAESAEPAARKATKPTAEPRATTPAQSATPDPSAEPAPPAQPADSSEFRPRGI